MERHLTGKLFIKFPIYSLSISSYHIENVILGIDNCSLPETVIVIYKKTHLLLNNKKTTPLFYLSFILWFGSGKCSRISSERPYWQPCSSPRTSPWPQFPWVPSHRQPKSCWSSHPVQVLFFIHPVHFLLLVFVLVLRTKFGQWGLLDEQAPALPLLLQHSWT